MTIALPASTLRGSRTPWIVLAPALASAACGVFIMVSPDTSMLEIAEMTGMVAESVESLQALVGTIASVDAVSGSIGKAIIEQESLAARVSSNLETMRDAVFTLSREIREAAQIASNSGMLSEIVLETANSVDGHMSALKKKLDDIGTGMGPEAFQTTTENRALS